MNAVTAAVNKAISSAIQSNPNMIPGERNILPRNDESKGLKQNAHQPSSYGDVRDLPTVQTEQSHDSQLPLSALYQARVLRSEIVLNSFGTSIIFLIF